jgi:hypothetical protein
MSGALQTRYMSNWPITPAHRSVISEQVSRVPIMHRHGATRSAVSIELREAGMTFQRWRKKPVVVEAVQWDGTAEGATPIINWILENDGTATFYGPGEWDTSCLSATHLVIDTLEGRMLASPTDYIIRGVQGEFYPCKSDIFTETYEPEACADQ